MEVANSQPIKTYIFSEVSIDKLHNTGIFCCHIRDIMPAIAQILQTQSVGEDKVLAHRCDVLL